MLVPRMPGSRSIPRTSSTDAHLLDIAPTVLEVLGIEREPGMRGTSIVPQLAAR